MTGSLIRTSYSAVQCNTEVIRVTKVEIKSVMMGTCTTSLALGRIKCGGSVPRKLVLYAIP